MKIGILEDYQALGRILQLSLGAAGHTVYAFQTVKDFLTFVASPVPADLIIVDFRLLADVSGVDVIRHIRTTFPQLPAILISAAPLTTLESAIVGLSRVKILQKPFKTTTLLEMITTIA